MSVVPKIAATVLILFYSQLVFSQQLRLGKNPYTVEKSAVLELYSDNQGLLLPRITDTSLINVLSPPDGMMVYFTPTQQLLIRANGYWQKITTTGSVVTSLNGNTGALTMDTTYISNFYLKVRGLYSASSPISYNSSTGVISIAQAGTATNGYLSNTDWNTFNNKLSSVDTTNISSFSAKVRSLFSGSAPITYSNGLIGITQATTSTNGYVSSSDWNTFNNKANSFANGNLTETGSGILTITGGTGSVIGTGTSIQVKQATATQSGYLSNTDWNTFNNKLSSIDTTNISNFSTKVRSLFSGSAPITYSNGLIGITQATNSTNGYLSSTDWNTFNNKANSFTNGNLTETGSGVLTITGGTGSVIGTGTSIQVKQATTSQSGYLSNTDWNTFNNKLSSVDTTNISNFSTKVRSLFSGSAPITYSNGLVGITQATTSTNGYLSSTDWNTFNNKANTSNVWLLAGNAGTNPSTNFIGTTDNQDLVFKTNNTEWARIVSSTGDIKIGSATTGTIRATDELVLRQDGDTYGPSILRLRNRTAENGAIFETTDPSITLVDFIFKTAASQRNIRFEARSTYARAGTPSFHIGGSSPDNPTLAVGDNYAAFNSNLKIGNYNTPTEALDVTGNIRFSGALMPNNIAGSSGQVLSSGGSGTSPTWINFRLSGLNDVSLTSPTNGQLLQYNGTNWVNISPSYLTSVDTTNISNFYLKVRSLHSVTAPLTYNSSTGVFGISQASTSTNGYLSSTDWNTFNNKQASGNYLLDPSGNGIVARTALNTTINRTITGTANRISLTNGDGVSGNPTIDISSSYVGQSSITTLGTVTTGTWNGNTIGIANGGTGQTTANAALNALLPAQSGNSGEVLTTDGTNTSWNATENTTLLTADVTNNNVTANTIADVTGLSFNVTSGNTYKFRFVIAFTAAATTTGSRWSINGPATTFLYYHSSYSFTTASTTENEGLSAYNTPAAANTSSAATGSNIAIIEGIIKPSASGTVIARFASEVSGSAIVAKTGSYVEFKKLN